MSNQDEHTHPSPPGTTFSARIMDAEKGEAIYLTDVPGHPEPIEVAGHGAGTPWVSIGDIVLATATPQGVVVFDRLRRPEEAPQIGFSLIDGAAILNGVRRILLQARSARVELSEDGEVRIND
jgi:hypothetical protein